MVLGGRKVFLVTGFIILLVGIGLIVGGILWNNSNSEKRENWTKINATVVGSDYGYEYDDDGFRETLYYAIVEYSVDGRTYRKTGNTSSRIIPSVGTSREVYYNPDNPSECVFAEDSSVMPLIIMCACGGGLIIGGLLTLVTYGKKR